MKNENVNRKVIEGKEQNDNKVVKGEKLNNDDYTQFIEDMLLKIKEICNKLSLDKDNFSEEQVYENILDM